MPQISYAYAVGRVRSLERTLLNPSALERLCGVESVFDVARALSDAGWGDSQDQSGVERLAKEQVSKACQLVRECTPDEKITDCFLIKYDILNLKTLIKARMLSEENPELSSNGLIDIERMRHAVNEGSYIYLPDRYQDALKQIEQKIAVDPDPMWLDARLDKLMFEIIADNVSKVKNCPDEILMYFKAKSDSVNMLTALRAGVMGRDADFAKDLYVTGGIIDVETLASVVTEPAKLTSIVMYTGYNEYVKRGMERFEQGDGLSPLEKQLDDYLISLLRSSRYSISSVTPLVGYLLAREREASAVRLIVTAKAVGASEETLLRLMRKLYTQ